MAIFKNEIPILEFDTEQNAVIMPGHHFDYNFPHKAVMLFMEPEIDDFVANNECEVVGKFVSVTKDFYVYKTQINNIDIAFVQAPLGGAGAVQIMEQLIAGGAKEIIATGCCGALVEDTEGSFFVPTAALRQEGTSYHYLPPSREIELDSAPIKAICRVLENKKLSYRICKRWILPRNKRNGSVSKIRRIFRCGNGVCLYGCVRKNERYPIWTSAFYCGFFSKC
jgi:hypothetical protein